ncbi:MAG TPA: RAMP superfamily CRISPR-associated protein, partial [Isosphaeraceae bacterium]|nr:RAMP superfamily CRISPR-associated protein [Isosphaeraceae bacterium]
MSWTFQNRWRIEVELQSSTPFHIGNGDILDEGRQADRESLERRRAPTLTDEQGRRRRVEVSTVVTDHRGRPYLPGTALKGAIRSWLLAHLTDPADRCRIEKVFGSEDTRRTDSVGGIAEFLDAFSVGSPPDQTHVPYADRERWTGIVASVAIDRRTRTAYEKKLYHEEYVPPGAKFQVVITGQNLDEEDVALILLALDQFPRKEPDPRRPFGFGGRPGGEASRALAEQVPEAIRLGAEGHDSSGLFARLGRPVVKRLLRKDVHAWLAEARNPSGSMAAYDGFDSVSRDVLLRLET